MAASVAGTEGDEGGGVFVAAAAENARSEVRDREEEMRDGGCGSAERGQACEAADDAAATLLSRACLAAVCALAAVCTRLRSALRAHLRETRKQWDCIAQTTRWRERAAADARPLHRRRDD